MTEHDITRTVNGDKHEFSVESRTQSVRPLRDELENTGTNVGYKTSMSGPTRLTWTATRVKPRTVLAVQANGSEITAVEGSTEDDKRHPTQEKHGLQRGRCAPGTMLTATPYSGGESEPEREDIRHALERDLRRGTGYQNIVSAIESAAETVGDVRRAN